MIYFHVNLFLTVVFNTFCSVPIKSERVINHACCILPNTFISSYKNTETVNDPTDKKLSEIRVKSKAKFVSRHRLTVAYCHSHHQLMYSVN